MKLNRKFFERDTLVVAKDLLGKYLVRKNLTANKKQEIQVGRIVETEAYIGEDDLACHASKGRTNRTEIMYGEAGHAYIYMIYGMYHCLNIVTEKKGFPAAVLIRAVEPIGKDQILTNLTNGPGKLCRLMDITRELNGVDVTKSEELYIVDKLPRGVILASETRPESGSWTSQDDNKKKFVIIEAKRVGIDYAKHCTDHLWRFYIKDNCFISKK